MAKLDQNTITQAALTIVGRNDHTDLTLSSIARELGVTQPALYYHVGGINDVLRWVGIAVRHDLVQVLSAATIGLSKADAIRSVADAWRGFSQEHPSLYRSTHWHPVQGDPELEAAVGHVLDVLAGALRGFDLSESQRRNAALALRSTLHGYASFELGAGNPSPNGADDSFIHVIELLITGVEALAAGSITQLASS